MDWCISVLVILSASMDVALSRARFHQRRTAVIATSRRHVCHVPPSINKFECLSCFVDREGLLSYSVRLLLLMGFFIWVRLQEQKLMSH